MVLEVVHNHISHGGIVLDDEDVYRSAVLLAYGNRSRRAVHDVRNDFSRRFNFPDEACASREAHLVEVAMRIDGRKNGRVQRDRVLASEHVGFPDRRRGR